jgi:hypothetical protein
LPFLFQDFTVVKPIVVTELGLIDLGTPGFSGSPSVFVIDRETRATVAGPFKAQWGVQRRNSSSNPFVFFPLSPPVRLERHRTFSLLAADFSADLIDEWPVHDSSAQALVITGNSWYNLSETNRLGSVARWTGSTMVYSVVAGVPTPTSALKKTFLSCEEVACEGLPSGVYSLDGVDRFCDNDAAGGGWTRIFSAADFDCASAGWTTGRNEFLLVNASDPYGCRPGAARNGLPPFKVQSPFAFTEVLGRNLQLFAVGFHDAITGSERDDKGPNVLNLDGVVVSFGGSPNDVLPPVAHVFAVGCETRPCPCQVGFVATKSSNRTLGIIGDKWSCSRNVNHQQTWTYATWKWVELFKDDGCSPRAAQTFADMRRFQTVAPSPQTVLHIAINKDEHEDDEDLKLADLELLVRRQAGFSKAACPAASTAGQPSTSSALSSTQTQTAPATSTPAAATDTSAQSDQSVTIIALAVVAGLALLLALVLAVCLIAAKRQGKQPQQPAVSEMVTAREDPSLRAFGTASSGSDHYTSIPRHNYSSLAVHQRPLYDNGNI